jgi:hypothetical protein
MVEAGPADSDYHSSFSIVLIAGSRLSAPESPTYGFKSRPPLLPEVMRGCA